MLEQNLQLIQVILKGDPTVSPPQRREYLRLLVNGKPPPEPPTSNGPRILRRKEAAAMLGRTVRSIDELAAQGVLRKIILPGRKRSGGILESSLLAAISG